MSDRPKARAVAMAVFAVALIGALVEALAGCTSPAPVVPQTVVTQTVTTTVTVVTTVTVPATTTVVPAKPPKPKTVQEWAFLTGGSASGGKLYIKADYIYFYPAGTAADTAHAKYGGSLRPDGSYVRNLSHAITTLTLKATADVQLIEWLETGTAGSSFKYGKADPNAFVAVLAGTANSPSGAWGPADKVVLLTVTASTVSAVKQYQPPQ